MNSYVIPAIATPSLAVAGGNKRFPIRRIFCVGRNYWWDASQSRAAADREAPFFFMKPTDALVAAEASITYPPLTHDFCHEIEQVVAIGKDGSDIAPEDALEHVWGYGVGLDLTRRDLQLQAKKDGRPWEGAKAFDASAASTALVPVDVAGHPQSGAIWLKVNGVERQRADIADQIWPVRDVISVISQSVRLMAGDLIFTGTPTGVAALQPGDMVSGGIDGIGQFSLSIAHR
jgi:fumarylpyruvate hydrolase